MAFTLMSELPRLADIKLRHFEQRCQPKARYRNHDRGSRRDAHEYLPRRRSRCDQARAPLSSSARLGALLRRTLVRAWKDDCERVHINQKLLKRKKARSLPNLQAWRTPEIRADGAAGINGLSVSTLGILLIPPRPKLAGNSLGQTVMGAANVACGSKSTHFSCPRCVRYHLNRV